MVAIYLDSADLNEMIRLNDKVSGFTTNPTLMRKAGVTDYKSWAKIVLDRFPDKPVSLEVFADDFLEMKRQARIIASWGRNVYVKIPITNTLGQSSAPIVKHLSDEGIKVNVTAVMTREQMKEISPSHPEIISVFCGRIQDTGRLSPIPSPYKNVSKILWASTRSVGDVYHAENVGYDIITLSPELIAKLPLKDKDLTQYSLETVKMFHDDAQKAGYTL
jgi:transaldolase